MKKIILPVFALMCLAQWFIPGKMIFDQETLAREGKVFKFKTAPVDPSDPFRGKYVTLTFEANNIGITDPREWETVKEVYVSLATEPDGFARISTVSMYEPEGTDYVKARVSHVTEYSQPIKLWIDYPFDKFYVEESKAAEAERLYWKSNADSTQVTYAVVSIKKGEAALKDVMINDRSIVDIVREMNLKNEK